MDRDSRGESGHRARAGTDTGTKCLSRLQPSYPIHLNLTLTLTLTLTLPLTLQWGVGGARSGGVLVSTMSAPNPYTPLLTLVLQIEKASI